MALIKCPECGKEISDTSKNCIHCGYKLNSNNSIDNKNNKIIIHGHTEKEPLKDLPIKIYEGENLITELERLGTFEFNLDRDTTLTFKYGLYKPISYTLKCNQEEEIFLSLDMFMGKVKIKSNLDNQAKTVENSGSINNATILNAPKEKNRHLILTVIGVIFGIWIIGFIYYSITPMNESRACTAIRYYVKKQMKDPSSAEFSDDCKVTKDSSNNNLWYIRGTVRGTNSFGGTVVQTYTVLMEVDGNEYEVKSVNFGW